MTKAYQINPARCKKSISLAAVSKEWKFNENFVYEVKEDGRRYLLQVRPNGAKKNYLTSRRVSVVTKEFVEKQNSIPSVRDYKFPKEWGECIFDGEWCGGETSNETATAMKEGRGYYVYWDILMFKGVDCREFKLWKRHLLLNKLYNQMPTWMRSIKSFLSPKTGLDYVRFHNREGLVRKDIQAEYGEGWTKAKRVHTEDVVIWGYEPTKSIDWMQKGWIGALLIGQWKRTKKIGVNRPPFVPNPGDRSSWNGKYYEFVDCGRVSGFTNELRDKFSKNQQQYRGSIIEIKFQLRFDTGKFRHPEFLRLRNDKNATDCVWAPKLSAKD